MCSSGWRPINPSRDDHAHLFAERENATADQVELASAEDGVFGPWTTAGATTKFGVDRYAIQPQRASLSFSASPF